MSAPAYLRNRATKLRERADNDRKTTDGNVRDQMVYAARQLEIAADEIESDFHVDDEEDV